MDLSKMTSTIQEAFAEAQQTAIRMNHPEIDIVHLWKALAEKSDSLLTNLYEHLGIGRSSLQLEIDRLIEKKPQVTGDGIKGGQYLHADLQHLLDIAERERIAFEDDYLSVEHFVLGLLELRNNELS